MGTEEAIKARIEDGSPDRVYSALILIGKEGRFDYRKFVEDKLKDPVPKLRSAAIRVLGFYWQEPHHESTAREMTLNPHEDKAVRSTAILAWTAYYRKTANFDVTKQLHSLLIDTDLPEDVREAAYFGIIDVSNLPNEKRASIMSVDLNDESSWVLVNELVDQSVEGRPESEQ